LDNSTDTTAATFKAGLNYQAGKRTYLRMNAGLGYRFPSIAEFFANASIEGFIVYPNPDLLPEYGGSGELGLKQGIKISKWLGYIDFALFWQEYYDMIEFTFDYYPPDPETPFDIKYLGFKSLNISRARIAGYELSFVGEGSFGKIPVRTFGGYTFTYPVELSADGGDESLNNLGNYLPRFFKSMFTIDDDILSGLLRYRYRHTVKADIEMDLGKFTVGTEFQYYSFVEKIDYYLEFKVENLASYRNQIQERRMQGDVFWNLRGAYNFDKYGKIAVIVNNVINRESSYRPAKMDPPLNFVFQYSVKI
jgi:iron complex outermembrane receptor protein